MKLDQYLREHGLSYREWSRRTGFPASQICRWATGKREPSLSQAVAICRWSNGAVTLDDLAAAASQEQTA